MDVLDKPADLKEVELTEVDKKTLPEKKKAEKAKKTDHKRQNHLLHPRRLGRCAGDAFLVGDCGALCIYYLFVYQIISSVASAQCVGLYGLCGVVCSIGGKVFVDVEKSGDGLYGTATGGER